MEGQFAYESIGFGALDNNFPHEPIGFGVMDDHIPHEFIGFGALDANFNLRIHRIWGHGFQLSK